MIATWQLLYYFALHVLLTVNVIAVADLSFLLFCLYCLPFVANKDDYNVLTCSKLANYNTVLTAIKITLCLTTPVIVICETDKQHTINLCYNVNKVFLLSTSNHHVTKELNKVAACYFVSVRSVVCNTHTHIVYSMFKE